MELNIGAKIKQLRTDKGLSIAELSKLSDVSKGLISQIERDMVVPSVVSLYKLATALDTNVSYFFDDKVENCKVIRKGNHKTMFTDNGTRAYELISPDRGDHVLDLVKITLKCSESEEAHQISHHGEECGYVVSGTLTVIVDGEKHILHPGDSIHFKSTVPHVYVNEQEEECVSIWAMTPRFF